MNGSDISRTTHSLVVSMAMKLCLTKLLLPNQNQIVEEDIEKFTEKRVADASSHINQVFTLVLHRVSFLTTGLKSTERSITSIQ
jgi:hypothetical protein